MNKTEILQRLIKEDKITIEELLILAEKEKEYIYSPTYIPYQPYIQPYNPAFHYPYVVTSDGTIHT